MTREPTGERAVRCGLEDFGPTLQASVLSPRPDSHIKPPSLICICVKRAALGGGGAHVLINVAPTVLSPPPPSPPEPVPTPPISLSLTHSMCFDDLAMRPYLPVTPAI